MRNTILLILVCVMFCIGEVTLTHFLPLAKTNYDEWFHYYIAKDAVYDAMFFLMSAVVFNVTHRVTKAVAFFFFLISGGSFIDKVIFNINQYLHSDAILIIGGLALSTYLYRTKWKT